MGHQALEDPPLIFMKGQGRAWDEDEAIIELIHDITQHLTLQQESVTQQTETNGSIKPSSSVNDVENPHSGKKFITLPVTIAS